MTTLNDTGIWEIWIDDLDGDLAMKKTSCARREIEVVELEVFDKVIAERNDESEKLEKANYVIELAYHNVMPEHAPGAKEWFALARAALNYNEKGTPINWSRFREKALEEEIAQLRECLEWFEKRTFGGTNKKIRIALGMGVT